MTGINQKPFFAGCLTSFPKSLLLILACLLMASGCATQDDLLVVYNRVISLEGQQKEAAAAREQMEDRLDESLSNAERDMSKLREDVAEIRANTNSLRNEIRAINGLMEEQGYQLRTKVGSAQSTGGKAQENVAILEARVESMQETLLRMESYLGMEGKPATAAPAGQGEALSAPQDLDEDQTYAQAKKDFDELRLEAAREGFKSFLTRFPNSSKADNALFWMGETFFKEKWYEKAILQYQEVIEKHPKANKVPAAYFKQGLAFSMLGDNSNARLIWTELIRKFPNSPEAVWAQKKLDAL